MRFFLFPPNAKSAPRKNAKNDNDPKTSARQAAWKPPAKALNKEEKVQKRGTHLYSVASIYVNTRKNKYQCWFWAPGKISVIFLPVWQYKWNVKYDFGMKSTHYSGKPRGKKSFEEEPWVRVNHRVVGAVAPRRLPPPPPPRRFCITRNKHTALHH